MNPDSRWEQPLAAEAMADDNDSPNTGFPRNADEPLNAALAPLVQRMALGDEAALAQFYDATLSRVYALALRITRRADAAEEVVGDVYLQVWRQALNYTPERGRVLAWLSTLTRSRALDSLRRRDTLILEQDPELFEEAGDDADPLGLLASVERAGAVRKALENLSQIQQQLVSLAFFRGLSHQEIADHTGVPLGSVKTHIRRALAALREVLSVGVTAL